MHACLCTLCVPGGRRGLKGASEGDWSYRRGSWELNLSPLEEQQVLLIAEPPVTFPNSCRHIYLIWGYKANI